MRHRDHHGREQAQDRDQVTFSATASFTACTWARSSTALLLARGHEDEARALAETSTGANQAYIAFLVRQARWHDLGKLVAEGNYQASSALLTHLNGHHDLDDTARCIKRYGLTPDGAVAG
jgi:hypothetical protein